MLRKKTNGIPTRADVKPPLRAGKTRKPAAPIREDVNSPAILEKDAPGRRNGIALRQTSHRWQRELIAQAATNPGEGPDRPKRALWRDVQKCAPDWGGDQDSKTRSTSQMLQANLLSPPRQVGASSRGNGIVRWQRSHDVERLVDTACLCLLAASIGLVALVRRLSAQLTDSNGLMRQSAELRPAWACSAYSGRSLPSPEDGMRPGALPARCAQIAHTNSGRLGGLGVG